MEDTYLASVWCSQFRSHFKFQTYWVSALKKLGFIQASLSPDHAKAQTKQIQNTDAKLKIGIRVLWHLTSYYTETNLDLHLSLLWWPAFIISDSGSYSIVLIWLPQYFKSGFCHDVISMACIFVVTKLQHFYCAFYPASHSCAFDALLDILLIGQKLKWK